MSGPRITRATSADIPAIMAFWDQHWCAGHIMARDAALVRWQHAAPATTPDAVSDAAPDAPVNFVIARDGAGEVLGFLGFIPSSRFDPRLAAHDTLMLAGWRVRDDAPTALGIALLHYLRQRVAHRAIMTLGLNSEVGELYRRMGFRLGALTHWVMPNPHYTGPRIAKLPAIAAPHQSAQPPMRLRRVEARTLTAMPDTAPDCLPAKTPTYFAQRYCQHPHYRYDIFALEDDDGVAALLATRTVNADGGRAVRIVDFTGREDALTHAEPALHGLAAAARAQYTDMMNTGLSADTMAAAGFHDVTALPGAMVPNLFEPLVRANRPIPYAVQAPDDARILLFKGDGDQDRPNITAPPAVISDSAHEVSACL